MKFSKLQWLALSLLALAACDKSTDIDNPEGPQGSGTMQAMSPAESKAFLETTAEKFLVKFNPADQKEIIDLSAYFAARYGEYKLPENFYAILGQLVPSPGSYFSALNDAASGDVSSLTRAATDFSYTALFGALAGVYEPDAATQSWIKTADADDIEFRFNNAQGQPVVLKAAQQGLGTGRINLTTDLTQNGASLASSTVSSTFDANAHTISANIDASMANLRAMTELEGKDKIVESRAQFFISNEQTATAYATLKGDGLCDPDRWKELKNTESLLLDNLIGKMIKKGYGAIDIMGDVQVYAQMDYYETLLLDIAGEYAGWGSTDKNMVKDACQQACDRLNKNVKAQLRYNGTKTDQATLIFQPVYKEWPTNWAYSASPMIKFPDNSIYTLEEYFAGFADMAPKFAALVQAYKTLWLEAFMASAEQ